MRHFKHTPDPANTVFHALNNIAAAQPRKWTRKLSYEEQCALSPEEASAYYDWLFAVNEPACLRRERKASPFDNECTDARDPYNMRGPHHQSRAGE